jgi:hypothetical protein
MSMTRVRFGTKSELDVQDFANAELAFATDEGRLYLAVVAEGTVQAKGATALTNDYEADITALLGLSDTPASYAGAAGQVLKVNIGETAMEFAADTGITEFTGLTDTPASYASGAGQFLRVDALETGLEFVLPTLLNLTDTPASYASGAGQALRVTALEDGIEFFTPTMLGLSDTPAAFVSGANVRINASGTAVEFVDELTAFDLIIAPGSTISTEVNAAAADACIFLKPGTHVADATITLKSGQHIVGCGDNTIVKHGGFAGALFDDGGGALPGLEIGNFNIDLDSKVQRYFSFGGGQHVRLHIHDITIVNVPNTGAGFAFVFDAISAKFERLTQASGHDFIRHIGGSNIGRVSIVDCEYFPTVAGGTGIIVRNADQVSIRGFKVNATVSSVGILVSTSTGDDQDVTISDFFMQGSGAGQGISVIAPQPETTIIDNPSIRNCTTGIDFDTTIATYTSQVNGGEIRSCTVGIDTNRTDRVQINGTRFQNCTTAIILSSKNCVISGATLNTGTTGVSITAAGGGGVPENLMMTGCNVSNFSGTGVLEVAPGDFNQIRANFFDTNGTDVTLVGGSSVDDDNTKR